jgi:glycosyltransferase involved in cell wall biosynthesis
MNQKEPDFSVIVLFGRGELEPCLGSLLKQSEENFEIIGVVGSEIPKVNDPRVKFLVIPDPNPAKRRNLAVAQSRGKYLAFIDDDATAPEDWLARAKKYFEQNREMAGFGGSNIGPENMTWREQLTDMILSDPYFGAGSRSYLAKGSPHQARPGEAHLSNFFLRREIFDQVKGFNEKIGYGGEDSEMVYWVKQKTGKDFWFFPELSVIHNRRPFGWELLKRNFRFRRNNGKMKVLFPEMYRWNMAFSLILYIVILFFLSIVPIGFLKWPESLLLLKLDISIYFVLFFIRSLFWTLKKRKHLCVIAPFVFFIHHLASIIGLTIGEQEGQELGKEKLQQLLGRD